MNLKLIGTAYQIWANDNGGKFPASQSVANGGWSDLLTNRDQGPNCWTNYAVMANELGRSKRILVCPTDPRWEPVWDSTRGSAGADVNADSASFIVADTATSYFVGVSANPSDPKTLIGGDRNLGLANREPVSDYGFSPDSGTGSDVAAETNSESGPLAWSMKMHSAGDAAGSGNVVFADGSVQQMTSADFRRDCQPCAGLTTNWPAGVAPKTPSFRIIFP